MSKSSKKNTVKTNAKPKPSLWARLRGYPRRYWHKGIWQKIVCVILAFLVLSVTFMYAIAQWYIYKHRNEPLIFGTTFIPSYARYFEVDPEETLAAMIDDLGIKRYRLVSYWSEIEKEPGAYDFSELDWQFDMIEKAGGTVSLSLGLRQPRWPECHMPDWAEELPRDQWAAKLLVFIENVVERYKHRDVLVSYQLENEYFLSVFGDCPDHSRERLVGEYNLVKSLDPNRTLIVTRSNNAVPSWPVGEPRADLIGASIYKRVWDKTVTNRYFEYPVPAWFYAFLAGGAELTTGKNTFVHEMQTEAWVPDGFGGLKDTSIEEQNKSFDASRMQDRINYGVATGMKTIDLWGVEWWYYRKVVKKDPSLWNAAQKALASHGHEVPGY